MEATFWIFDKRQDSTAVPSSVGTKINVLLKEGSDLDHPVFKIHTKTLLKATYMLWEGSYYFITGRKYIYNEYYEISCDIDALGTCRSQIMSSSQYVLRSTVSPDYNLIDTLYPTKSNPTIYSQTKTDLGANNTGHYVLMTISGAGVVYYAMTQSEFDSFLSAVYAEKQEDWYQNITELSGSLVKQFLNVTDYIIGCRWIPFSIKDTGNSDVIHLGYWTTGSAVTVYKATTPLKYVTISFALHPTTAANKAFMNTSAYHSVQISIPGCGTYPIDYAKFKGASTGKVVLCVDVLGNITGAIQNADNDILTLVSGSLGQEVPVSSRTFNLSGAVVGGAGGDSIAAGLASIGSGNYAQAAGEILGGAIGVAAGVAASVPDVNTKGSVGSYYYDLNHLTVDVLETVYDIPSFAPTQQGYPCMKVMTLSTAGFYMIKNPQVDFGDDLFIKNQIEGYMARGFYVE